jgi:hypothetical protein
LQACTGFELEAQQMKEQAAVKKQIDPLEAAVIIKQICPLHKRRKTNHSFMKKRQE